ncbi:glycosyltransferase family 4 protein [Echinicola sp. CAU 1574]|uniref:Glycosyltransferase family 4 protein n=1 Tax=Echinicola arenosa TaxID=2774144 RepID=A0ABR9AIW3_9BACT|nr:glycosyltransferase family 4 protein [Echinicola arenosa]MBD8488671.1 glycosyltransferase family 4 protein [Echinicola arenosa]
MRLIYIHQYFLKPEEGGAVRSYHLAKGMVDAGMEVEMVTAHSENTYDYKVIDGIKVHYLPVSYDNKFGFIKRTYAFLKFVRMAKKLLMKLKRPDLLYISSTPLTTGLIGLWAKEKLALPYVFEVRDLWPEAPIQVGAVKNPLLKRMLYGLEKRIYDQALKVVTLSPGIRTYVENCSPNVSTSLIPNFSDVNFFQPSKAKSSKILDGLNWKAKNLSISYTGAIGEVNAVQELLFLAKEAQNQGKEWQFAIKGKGKKLQELKGLASKLQLKNLQFLPFGDKSSVRDLLSVTDLAFISFDHLPVLQTNSPNKFFDALAMGNGILINHEGWVWDLTKSNHLGILYDVKQVKETICRLEILAEDETVLKAMKQRSRNLAMLHFSKEMAISKLLFTLDPKRFPRPVIDEVYMLTA